MSPLQYQKQIRLQTARALLLAQSGDVAGIGFNVTYESPSQFSREYARQFGVPPSVMLFATAKTDIIAILSASSYYSCQATSA